MASRPWQLDSLDDPRPGLRPAVPRPRAQPSRRGGAVGGDGETAPVGRGHRDEHRSGPGYPLGKYRGVGAHRGTPASVSRRKQRPGVVRHPRGVSTVVGGGVALRHTDDTGKVGRDPNWKENSSWPALTGEGGGGGTSGWFSRILADSRLGVRQMALGGKWGSDRRC
jgi:hypothetical protein